MKSVAIGKGSARILRALSGILPDSPDLDYRSCERIRRQHVGAIFLTGARQDAGHSTQDACAPKNVRALRG